MQIKMTDIIENYEGMSLEAISLLPQVPHLFQLSSSLFNLSFLRNLYIPMNPLIDNLPFIHIFKSLQIGIFKGVIRKKD